MIITPNCPLCEKTMVFSMEKTSRLIMECPTLYEKESHYIWMWTYGDILGSTLYDFSEIFSIGKYRIVNKLNVLGVTSTISYILPKPEQGTDYKYLAGHIFSVSNRIQPTKDENNIKTYIVFS